MLKRVKGFTLIELLIVVAIIAILAAIAIPNFLEAQTRAKVSRVRNDMRNLALALESYYLDTNAYPAQDSSLPGQKHFGANDIKSLPANKYGLRYMPTFRNKGNQNDPMFTLTTPVSYITSYNYDVFADTKGATFAYSVNNPATTNSYGGGYLLWSFGPDADENEIQSGSGVNNTIGGDITCSLPGTDMSGGPTPPYVTETMYNPGLTVPQQALLDRTYDPSNGTTSNGDLWRNKQ